MPTAESFLRDYSAALAHNLAHDCLGAAREIVRTLAQAGELPAEVTELGVFQVILSLRATLELMAVEHRFGAAAHDLLLAAMDESYSATILAHGRFTSWIAAAHETMRRSENPRDWMRIHAMNILGTRDPESSTFHTALGYGYHAGASIANVVAANVGAADGAA